MTTVDFEKRGSRWKLTVSGHAGYSEKDDIVCAAVSGITGGAVNYFGARLSEAKVEIEAEGNEEVFNLLYMAYLNVANQYPEHVRVIRQITK